MSSAGTERNVITAHPALAGVTVAYYLGFLGFGIATSDPNTVPYGVFVAAAMGFVAFLYARAPLSAGVLWALSVWGAAHMAGGFIDVGDGVLYNQKIGVDLIRYDRLVHAFGFGSATLVAWQTLRPRLHPEQLTGAGLAVLVALTGMGVGALNEVVEFFVTRIQENSNVGGYDNTGWDLVANTLGAATAATWAVVVKDRTIPPPAEPAPAAGTAPPPAAGARAEPASKQQSHPE